MQFQSMLFTLVSALLTTPVASFPPPYELGRGGPGEFGPAGFGPGFGPGGPGFGRGGPGGFGPGGPGGFGRGPGRFRRDTFEIEKRQGLPGSPPPPFGHEVYGPGGPFGEGRVPPPPPGHVF